MTTRGIAMVTVLMVLASVMLLGIASLVLTRSNLLISENLVTNSIARGHAEAGIDSAVALLFEQYKSDGRLPDSAPGLPRVMGLDAAVTFAAADGTWYDRISDDRVALRIVGHGPRNAEFVAEALVEFTAATGGGASPFTGAVVACEEARVSNSGLIDSFDSRLGRYTSGARGYNGHVLTLSPGGEVAVTGSSPIYGDVNSSGGVRVTGSAAIHGNTHANGDVLLNGNTRFHGGISTMGSVSYGNSATVNGNILANGGLWFGNWSAQALGTVVQVGGDITKNTSRALDGHMPNADIRVNDSPEVQPVPDEPCDPLEIQDVNSAFAGQANSGPMVGKTGTTFLNWNLAPGEVQGQPRNGSWEVAPFATSSFNLLGRNHNAYSVSRFEIGNDGSATISGGDVVLLVDGDFIATGNTKLIIDEGSSLTVFVTGKVELGNSFRVIDGGAPSYPELLPRPVNSNGVPTFSIYSSYTGTDGVKLTGAGRLSANIYAPLTEVQNKNGTEFQGAVRGKSVYVTGNGDLHYDSALGDVSIGGGPGGGGEPTVRILSRR